MKIKQYLNTLAFNITVSVLCFLWLFVSLTLERPEKFINPSAEVYMTLSAFGASLVLQLLRIKNYHDIRWRFYREILSVILLTWLYFNVAFYRMDILVGAAVFFAFVLFFFRSNRVLFFNGILVFSFLMPFFIIKKVWVSTFPVLIMLYMVNAYRKFSIPERIKDSRQEIDGYVSALMGRPFGLIQTIGVLGLSFMYGYASWILKIQGCMQLTFWVVLLWILLLNEISFYSIRVFVEKGIYEDERVY